MGGRLSGSAACAAPYNMQASSAKAARPRWKRNRSKNTFILGSLFGAGAIPVDFAPAGPSDSVRSRTQRGQS